MLKKLEHLIGEPADWRTLPQLEELYLQGNQIGCGVTGKTLTSDWRCRTRWHSRRRGKGRANRDGPPLTPSSQPVPAGAGGGHGKGTLPFTSKNADNQIGDGEPAAEDEFNKRMGGTDSNQIGDAGVMALAEVDG